MPYQVQQLLEGKGYPTCVTRDDAVSKSLSLMIEHDFSQLPVVKSVDDFDIPDGLITYEGILRGIRNFKARIEDLKVRDVMDVAPISRLEDDLFDILERLKNTNAVLVVDGPESWLAGIVTSYDTAEYFRSRTEDLMRVEDIELMVKDFIRAAYTEAGSGELDETKLNAAVARVVAHTGKPGAEPEKPKAFDDLSLGDYVALLMIKETWSFFEPIFELQRDAVRELMNGVREIRNALAHFRGDISAEQRDHLRFAAEWLNRCQEEYQARLEKEKLEKLLESVQLGGPQPALEMIREPSGVYGTASQPGAVDFSVTEVSTGGGIYAPLADWLQSQPGRVDQVPLTFTQIEEIIKTELPASARNHRAWWANDSVGHSHSQLWLAAGWRTTYVNLSECRVTFTRIREREKAYIAFYSKLLDDLRKNSSVPVKDVSPDGASWIVICSVPREGALAGYFSYSFSRDKRFRVELYLDLGDQAQTKAAFDHLLAQKGQIEAEAGAIDWERLPDRRASRLAIYHEGHIGDEKGHAELRKWAVVTMAEFYNALLEPAESAILQVRNG
jgi:CBS domain-containing protein